MANSSPPSGQLPGPVASGRDFTWLFFGFRGRIGRQVYWLSIGFLVCVLFIVIGGLIALVGEEGTNNVILPLALASLWCEMALLVKRQHDRGMAWFWCLLAFVPIVGVLWMVAAGVIEGDPGPNAYGDGTDVPPG